MQKQHSPFRGPVYVKVNQVDGTGLQQEEGKEGHGHQAHTGNHGDLQEKGDGDLVGAIAMK
jgi:hypothetical protein